MKKKFIILLSAAFFSFIQFSFAQSDQCLTDLTWLIGKWKMQGKESIIVEEWSSKGSTMECRSYEVNGSDTILTETSTMSCIARKQVFTYHPVPGDLKNAGQAINFVLISKDGSKFVFENKQHDFPQRVVYQMVSSNECHAWIEGEEHGKMNKVDFYYNRFQ